MATLFLVVAGFVVLVTGLLSRAQRLPRNFVMGIRLPATLKSDAAWRAAHLAVASELIGLGTGILIVGVLAISVPPLALFGVLIALVGLMHSSVIAHRAARRADDGKRG